MVARLTTSFYKVHKKRCAISFCRWHLPFLVQCIFPLTFCTLSLVLTLSFNRFNIQGFSQHIIVIPQYIFIPSHSTYSGRSIQSLFQTRGIQKFSVDLAPHIVRIIAFSILLKIVISSSLRHHVSLPCNIANLTLL